jgi:hypothetical protein
MAAIDQGKKIGVRWSGGRYQEVKDLGWEDLDEGVVIDRALERAKQMDQLAWKIDKAFRGEITLLELISQLNQVRNLQ